MLTLFTHVASQPSVNITFIASLHPDHLQLLLPLDAAGFTALFCIAG